MLTAPADVLILPMTEDISPAISLATQLRQASIRTQLYTEQKKFKAKMSYADKLKVPFVLFLGEDEVNAAAVSIKNMRTGEQETIPRSRPRAGCFPRSPFSARASPSVRKNKRLSP